MNIVIDGIIIPPKSEVDRYDVLDLEKSMNYYPFYLRHVMNSNGRISPISPAHYMNTICSVVRKTGAERAKLLEDYSHYMGARFRLDLEKYHKLYEAVQKRPLRSNLESKETSKS